MSREWPSLCSDAFLSAQNLPIQHCFRLCRQTMHCNSALFDSAQSFCYLYGKRKQMTIRPKSQPFSCLTKVIHPETTRTLKLKGHAAEKVLYHYCHCTDCRSAGDFCVCTLMQATCVHTHRSSTTCVHVHTHAAYIFFYTVCPLLAPN